MAVDVTEYHLSVIKSPPGWEVGVYAAGALALLGIAAVSLWKLWTSGSFPSPSPFPNYDYSGSLLGMTSGPLLGDHPAAKAALV